MKTITFAALILVVAIGCQKSIEPAATERTRSGTDVDVLFTDSDGYTVKRFTDGGHYRYYVTPGPAKVASSYRVQAGKYHSEFVHEIQTAGK